MNSKVNPAAFIFGIFVMLAGLPLILAAITPSTCDMTAEACDQLRNLAFGAGIVLMCAGALSIAGSLD